MRRLSRVAFSLLMLTVGCLPEMNQCDEVCVSFDIGRRNVMKSAVSPEEDIVEGLNLYAYCDGNLAASGYFKSGEQPQLKLLFGHRYDLYALANMGPVEADPSEVGFRENCLFQVAGVGDLGERLPMAWSTEDFVVTSPLDRVDVMLERLVAKVLFSVDKTALSGLGINSVRIRQSPLLVWPFRSQTGSRSDLQLQVADGDYATQDDLAQVNEGGQITFYVLENCQGRLLEGNSDPWAKIPENIPDRAGLCTYLEVSCSFKPGYFYSGDVVYRLYLGRDSVSDFDIRRNTVLNASLFLTDDALGRVSWRVDADVSVNSGYAGGWISRGMHSAEDLYVGERFEYTLSLAEEVMEHIDWNPANLHLCMKSPGAGSVTPELEFGGLEPVGPEVGTDAGAGGNVTLFKVSALCRGPGMGTLELQDDDGKTIADLGILIVRKPRMVVSGCASVPFGTVVPGLNGPPRYDINGDAQGLCLYLTDNRGYNLNASAGCGFDLSLFDVSLSFDDMPGRSGETMDAGLSEGSEGDDGPACKCSVMSMNDGLSEEKNRDLLSFLSSGDFAHLLFEEMNFDLSTAVEFMLGYLPVSLTLVDNGWAGYADCQLSMLVENPSNLPVDIQCWQLNLANDNYNAIIRNEILDLYGKKFTRKRFDYICGAPASGLKPYYCSVSRFSAVLSGAYPMPELSTTNIFYALQYDYMGQASLSHHIDAVFSDGTPVYDLKAINLLADGSMEYSVIYGTDGWNDKGIWLYTAGKLLSRPSSDFDALSGVKPVSLAELYRGNTGLVSVGYNAGSQNIVASVNSSADVGIPLDAEITIEAEGYVQTTPNGTWGKKVDNYCTATVARKVKGVPLSTTFSAIDGNALKDAMDAVYAHTYFDSYNAIGSSNSYAHNAHPVSLKVTLNFSLSGSYSEKIRQITASVPSTVTFHHSQENVSYSVPVSTVIHKNSMAFVENIL